MGRGKRAIGGMAPSTPPRAARQAGPGSRRSRKSAHFNILQAPEPLRGFRRLLYKPALFRRPVCDETKIRRDETVFQIREYIPKRELCISLRTEKCHAGTYIRGPPTSRNCQPSLTLSL